MRGTREPLRGEALRTAAVDTLSAAPAGLLTDLDGTLSPIAARPELARISARTRRTLRLLAARLAIVAAISGRSADDARRLVRVRGLLYIGNHGLEAVLDRRRWVHPDARGAPQRLARVLVALRPRLAATDVRFEPKGLSLSVHYRGAADPLAARESILGALAATGDLTGLAVVEGRQVVDVRPAGRMDKGAAATCVVRRYGLHGALFLGDDRTDLDAIRALQGLRARGEVRALTVAVASAEAPPELLAEADGVLDGVEAAEDLLAALAVKPS